MRDLWRGLPSSTGVLKLQEWTNPNSSEKEQIRNLYAIIKSVVEDSSPHPTPTCYERQACASPLVWWIHNMWYHLTGSNAIVHTRKKQVWALVSTFPTASTMASQQDPQTQSLAGLFSRIKLQEHETSTCPICQQPIPNKLSEKLAAAKIYPVTNQKNWWGLRCLCSCCSNHPESLFSLPLKIAWPLRYSAHVFCSSGS